MSFEWDCRKAASNLKKHGVGFADAATVFYDESAVTIQEDSMSEARFITLGMDALARILVIVYTWREDHIRIISARKVTPGERLQYERNL